MGASNTKDHEAHFGKNNRKIVVLGLAQTGKSSMAMLTVDFCKKISEGKFIYDYITTEKPRFYEIQYEFQDWTLIDVGGTPRSSMHWRNFMEGAHGIVFMIDASKKQEFELVKLEIENLINNYYA